MYQGIDLFIRKHSPGTLRKGRHWSTPHPVSGGAANRGIVRNGEEHGISQSNRWSALAARAVASSAILRIENIEIHDFAG